MKAATWVPMNNQLWFRRISTTRINCAQPRQRGFPGSSAGKESTCNARDPVQFLGWKIPWRRDRLPTPVFLGFPGGSDSKESTCNAGDLGSTPGFGRSPGGGHGNPCQILAWRIPMDGEAWRATVHGARKRQTRLNDEAQHSTAPRHTFQKPFPCKRYNSGIQSGAKGPEWKVSLQSTLAGQGSCVHAYPSAIPQG